MPRHFIWKYTEMGFFFFFFAIKEIFEFKFLLGEDIYIYIYIYMAFTLCDSEQGYQSVPNSPFVSRI